MLTDPLPDGSKDWLWNDGHNEVPTLIVSNAGCWQWTGTAAETVRATGGSEGYVENHQITKPVTFELSEDGLNQAAITGIAFFDVVDPPGEAQYQSSGTVSDCRYAGGPTLKAIAPGEGSLAIELAKWTTDYKLRPGPRIFDAGGIVSDLPTMIMSCRETDAIEIPMFFPWWIKLPGEHVKLGDDGRQISGTFRFSDRAAEIQSTANLRSVR